MFTVSKYTVASLALPVALSCRGPEVSSDESTSDSSNESANSSDTLSQTSSSSDTASSKLIVASSPLACDDVGEAVDASGTTPGSLASPWPTIEHLSLVWDIEGDDNHNGVVTVRYRESGQDTWHRGATPLNVPTGTAAGRDWTSRHAGSLFELEADTTYEVELSLRDPDGGCETRTLEATTRDRPQDQADAPVLAVTPGSLQSMAASAKPGDILELAAGSYGEFSLSEDGETGAPIVIRGGEGVVFDSDIRLDGRSHVIVQGVTVNGQIKLNGAKSVAIVECTINATRDGIAMLTYGENLYIADNVVTGATNWTPEAFGGDGDNVGEGIVVTGPGHVIEHNRVIGFRDGISLLEDDEAVDQFSVDILANDIRDAADDGIEADSCFHNCRVLGNRITNSFIAISSQPGLGGPTYFIRNAMYNVVLSAFKLQRGSIGDMVINNTVVKNGDALGIYTEDVFSHLVFRNNLAIGGPGGEYGGWSSGSGRVLALAAADSNVDLDYDGLGSVTGDFEGLVGEQRFSTIEELRETTTEKHAVEVDLGVFQESVAYPESVFPALEAVDLRIDPNGDAVDAGVVIPGIHQSYEGAAPDLGAYEAGAALPNYGPRL